MTKESSHRLPSTAADGLPPRPRNPRAYYQPILALDSRAVIGYEALGRDCIDGGASSLGAYFAHPLIEKSDKMELDARLREQAVREHVAKGRDEMLFLNLQPGWFGGSGSTLPDYSVVQILRLLEAHSLDPAKVCIEVTEEEFDGEIELLVKAVQELRRAGCSIAVDDVGSRFSNLDRIAHIQPELLKVDMSMISRSAHHEGFHGVLRSLSAIADEIGASLLMEGVETHQDLQRAISAGARYVQGYLFSRAEAAFGPPDRYVSLLDAELLAVKRRQAAAENESWQQAEVIACAAEELAAAQEQERGSGVADEEFVQGMLDRLDTSCIRAYLCRSDGIQLSANYQRMADGWARQDSYLGCDWSWRPYFVYSSCELLAGRRFAISRPYTDLEKNGRVRTVSVPAGRDCFLLVDVRE